MSADALVDSYQLEASQVYATSIIGPPIVGWLVAILLFGAVAKSYSHYVQTDLYRSDSRLTKAVLHAVVLLATAQTTCSFWLTFHYATWQQRDSATLYAQTSIDCLVLTFVGLEGALVQLFLAYRATLFMRDSKWRYPYWALVTAGVLVGLAGAQLYLAASVLSRSNNPLPAKMFNWAVGAWLWGCTLTDCLVTATLALSLRRKMARFSRRTDSVLARLILLAVQSALPTALFSLTGAVLAYAFPADSLYSNVTGAMWAPLTGLYALSLLATLGGRTKVREVAEREQTWHLGLTGAEEETGGAGGTTAEGGVRTCVLEVGRARVAGASRLATGEAKGGESVGSDNEAV